MVQSSAFSSSSYPAAAHPNTLSAASRSFTHLARYLESPLHVPSVEAFRSLAANAASLDRSGTTPLILDSGCGLGRSTRRIAESNPESIVIGVDRSEHRLRKGDSAEGSALPENALFVQAELATFCGARLLQHEELAARCTNHYVLYPNPYPKPRRLNLRWHGHPALPILLSIGDTTELRSNWPIYLHEFRDASACVARAARARRRRLLVGE